MKDYYLLIISIFLITYFSNSKLHSQVNYGIKIGVNFDNIGDIKSTSSLKNQIETASIASAHIGMFVQLQVVDIYIRPELQISQNKSDILSLDQIEINKVEIPILIGYNIFGPISIFTGPIFQNIISIKSKSLNFGNYTNNFTMGLQIGSRIEFGKFGLGFRFERGFTDNEIEILGNNNIDIEAYSDIRPKLWSVSLTYKLGKKKDIEY
ncbi:MAG: hypothetical protein EVA36_00560 [Flavobacteriales bacterium]|nr:MAG: hypothetical protein CBC56_003475 [Flavobacteriales bacterium TMED96]RZP12395.1 MAG: hypothetical protein EVA36_00560 [Flavobacteriales bacterium]|tara:strand:- start:901 stop:1527 length:627 start_codon:yes stop_codon:yes gene_type:complete